MRDREGGEGRGREGETQRRNQKQTEGTHRGGCTRDRITKNE